jgi:methionyl-tRNA formyltransferase
MTRVVFMGTPEFALPALERLAAGAYEIVGVYTQPDRPAGRGQQTTAPPVKRWALAHGLRVFSPATFRKPEAVEELRSLRPELVVVAAYGKLLPPAVLDIPPKGAVNIHPSLLPKYRGASPVAAAILAGDTVTGVTIMLLDEGMDSGPVLAQRREPVQPEDTTQSLTRRLALAGAELLMETLPSWLAGAIRPLPQDPAQATMCPRISKEDGEINWTRPAEEIARRVRAYYPWPGSATRWRGKGLKVIRAQAVLQSAGEPGTVALLGTEAGKALVIACGLGALRIDEVQPEGRRPMGAQEFLAGYKAITGERLPS